MIKIDKGIPLVGRAGSNTYPFKDMEVNDSFAVEKVKIGSLQSAASNYMKNNKETKFTIRTVGDLVRIWRIA